MSNWGGLLGNYLYDDRYWEVYVAVFCNAFQPILSHNCLAEIFYFYKLVSLIQSGCNVSLIYINCVIEFHSSGSRNPYFAKFSQTPMREPRALVPRTVTVSLFSVSEDESNSTSCIREHQLPLQKKKLHSNSPFSWLQFNLLFYIRNRTGDPRDLSNGKK